MLPGIKQWARRNNKDAQSAASLIDRHAFGPDLIELEQDMGYDEYLRVLHGLLDNSRKFIRNRKKASG